MPTKELNNLFISPDCSIQNAIERINLNEKGIVIVVDVERHIMGTVTDGDIRRGILRNVELSSPVATLISHKEDSPYPSPITAPIGTSETRLIQMMNEHNVRHIPLVDDEERVHDVAVLADLIHERDLPISAVVMAGGYGVRLLPLTENVPKPMLPVGDQPVMEHILKQLNSAGINRVNVTTHYLPKIIEDHFGDGSRFGLNIQYVNEETPLGTAGALGLIEDKKEPLLVINGDILTKMDFRAMNDYHKEHKADMTVAVRQYDFQIPYGVLECEGVKVYGVNEKPLMTFFVNAGVYLLEPSVSTFIPSGKRFDMTDLIQALISDGRSVVSFPIMEYWLDIGQLEDYERAQRDIENGTL